MSVREYYSSDPEAPVLSGEAGTLVNLLKKCLVDGYGDQGQGTWKPGLGWEGVYSGDYAKAAFRSTAEAGTKLWLYVNDNGGLAGGTKDAHVRGWEGMTGLDANGDPVSGEGPFPLLTGQLPSGNSLGLVWNKSIAASSAVRSWALIGDECAFWLGMWNGYTSETDRLGWYFFGDIVSFRADDAFHCAVIGGVTENTSSWSYSNGLGLVKETMANLNFTGTTGHYLARGVTQVGGCVGFSGFGVTGSSAFANSAGQYPSPADGGLALFPPLVGERLADGSGCLRGVLPGLFQTVQNIDAFIGGPPIEGHPSLGGRKVKVLQSSISGSINFGAAFDVAGPWR